LHSRRKLGIASGGGSVLVVGIPGLALVAVELEQWIRFGHRLVAPAASKKPPRAGMTNSSLLAWG